MSDSWTTLNSGSGGDSMDEEAVTYGTSPTTRKRPRMRIGGTNAAELAKVANADPGSTDYGLVVRSYDGADATGVVAPTGGTGVRGWLSGIYSRLATGVARSWTLASGTDSVTVTGTVTSTPSGTQAVSGAFFQTTQPVSGTVTADTELPAAAALTDATANPTTPSVAAMNMGFNGTTWDRLQVDTNKKLQVVASDLQTLTELLVNAIERLAVSGGIADQAGRVRVTIEQQTANTAVTGLGTQTRQIGATSFFLADLDQPMQVNRLAIAQRMGGIVTS